MVRNEDEKELANKYDKVHIDSKSATAMFEIIKKKVSHTAANPHFLSVLQHILLLPRKTSYRCCLTVQTIMPRFTPYFLYSG